MKVTVCELKTSPALFERDWADLVAHVRHAGSDLVLLPEMPFSPWAASSATFDPSVWVASLRAHDNWLRRLAELAPAIVLSTRPVQHGARRLNEVFAWTASGYRAAHHKSYLPQEDGFWEATWFDKGDGTFEPLALDGLRVGFLVCTELWFQEHARAYGRGDVQILATPRASESASVERWVLAGRVAAIVAGAYSLSSNHAGPTPGGGEFGGRGWIIAPDGDVLALTSPEERFATVEIDLAVADAAKQTYPRYVR